MPFYGSSLRKLKIRVSSTRDSERTGPLALNVKRYRLSKEGEQGVDPFWSNLFRIRQDGEDALFELVAKVPIFQDLNRREFRRLEGILHRRSLATGEAVVREGEKGVGMYIILSGEVRIVQRGEDGSDQQLAVLGEGDFFGEQALLDDTPRSASALAAEPCQVIGFFRPDLLNLIESSPRLGLKIVMRLSQMISVRLRHTNRLLKEARMRVRKAEMEKKRVEEDRETRGMEDGMSEPVVEAEESAMRGERG